MIWYAAGLVWIIQIFFWGLGLTFLATPARWRRFWPAFCAPVGLALQSLVVWIGTHTRLPGTDSYAVASQLIPAALLGLALRRHGLGGVGRWFAGGWRWWPVALIMAVSLSVQAYPFTKPPGVLTSVALSSCDAADYAAGARVFKEFASNDRSGYLGNTEITRQLSVDNFFDFWLRINHFSPSAIIALNASLYGRQPYELVSLFGVVLLTLHLPGVFWLARSAFRFGRVGSLAVTAVYGFSPSVFYAVYQTALGQLLATPAVALLTWAGWQAYRGPKTWQRLARWSGLLLVGDWLLFGGYNFFILFAYVPVIAYVGIQALRRRDWAGTGRWGALIGANLVVCAVLFPDRVMSIVERFRLFNQTPFGWSIPGFWPSGWYGAFADTELHAAGPGWAVPLGVIGLAAAVAAAWQQARRGRWHAGLLAGCCTLPILCGYWWLLREDRLRHDHASYDAFKLFTVFYPGILIALCLFLRGPHATWPRRAAAAGLWAALLAVNLTGAGRFNAVMRKTPLVVDPDLASLAAIERMPAVTSINVGVISVWDQLWANAFLLHKPQFFTLATYEGRMPGTARGEWDLSRQLVSVRMGGERNLLEPNRTFALYSHEGNASIEARLDQGWYPVEHTQDELWCWGRERPTIRVDNRRDGTRNVSLGFSVGALGERHLQLRAGDRLLWEGLVGTSTRVVDGVAMALPPGTTILRLETPEAPSRSPGDPRVFTFLLTGFQVDVQPLTANRSPATLPHEHVTETVGVH